MISNFFILLLLFYPVIFLFSIKADTNYKDSPDGFAEEVLLRNDYIRELLPAGVEISQTLIDMPMPKLNKKSSLGKILNSYYESCLGGQDNWNAIKSVKINAVYDSLDGIYEYKSVYKKPNFFKIIISNDESRTVIASQGSSIHQKQTSEEGLSSPELAFHSDRMIFENKLSSFLLFPLRADQHFKYCGPVREFNKVLHKIRLFQGTDFIIDYYIDIETHFVSTIKITEKSKEYSSLVLHYLDFRKVNGVNFAHQIDTFIEGSWDSSLFVKEMMINVGAPSWIFTKNDG